MGAERKHDEYPRPHDPDEPPHTLWERLFRMVWNGNQIHWRGVVVIASWLLFEGVACVLFVKWWFSR